MAGCVVTPGKYGCRDDYYGNRGYSRDRGHYDRGYYRGDRGYYGGGDPGKARMRDGKAIPTVGIDAAFVEKT